MQYVWGELLEKSTLKIYNNAFNLMLEGALSHCKIKRNND